MSEDTQESINKLFANARQCGELDHKIEVLNWIEEQTEKGHRHPDNFASGYFQCLRELKEFLRM
jgi:hypothetical protein